tara:strand:+ start:2274 stop:3290 length:1017 start_codon:yes stop_codon:yes gene_type:complete
MQRTFKYLIILLCFTSALQAQDLSEKANAFLTLLTPELHDAALFSLEDAERFNMNYIPIDRKGPTFHDFNEAQKQAALNLLKASISKQAFDKAMEIRDLEKVLKIIENNDATMSDGRPRRDPLNYHFCIFGKPSSTEDWGWRFEGHHISMSFTSSNGQLASATPFFLGTNPGIVKIDEQRGKQVLRAESELGLSLVNSLSPEQLKMAKFSDTAPADIITTNIRKVEGVEKKGIPFNKFDKAQKETFMALLEVYIGNYIFEFSETFRDKINDAGLENLTFAWAGGMKEGTGTYYRIHGPMLLIEFDNTQNDANHVHVVIRDLANDYAEDLLQKHYVEQH